jgi:hypothetical protein
MRKWKVMGVENWNFAANFLWGKMTQVLLGAEGEGATPLVLVVRHSIRLVRLRRTHFDQISNLPPSFINFIPFHPKVPRVSKRSICIHQDHIQHNAFP